MEEEPQFKTKIFIIKRPTPLFIAKMIRLPRWLGGKVNYKVEFFLEESGFFPESSSYRTIEVSGDYDFASMAWQAVMATNL